MINLQKSSKEDERVNVCDMPGGYYRVVRSGLRLRQSRRGDSLYARVTVSLPFVPVPAPVQRHQGENLHLQR